MAGIPLREIPYTGAGPGLTAVLAGQVALVFGNALTVQPTSRVEGCAHSASPAPNVQPHCPTCPPSPNPGETMGSGNYGVRSIIVACWMLSKYGELMLR